MSRQLITFCLITALAACGQTARDGATGTGGHAGSSSGGIGGGGSAGGGVGGGSGGTAGATSTPCIGSHWKRFSPPPGAVYRHDHSASAWNTDQVIVWGGRNDEPGGRLGTGWRVFADGSVLALPIAGAPSPRYGHAFDILGNRLFVWGGDDQSSLGDGAWLDLGTDTWSPLPGAGPLLSPRSSAFSGAVGKRWLVWGGGDSEGALADGALYDPDTGSWLAISENAPVASSIGTGTALAHTGDNIGPVVFGGRVGAAMSSIGYNYASASDAWWEMPSEGAPSPRGWATLTWSPGTDEVIVWGGFDDKVALGDGAKFSLFDFKTWKPMNAAGAPSARSRHHAVMLGSKLVIFGGEEQPSGGIYDTATDSWEPLPTDDCAPAPRPDATFTAFGNGKQALYWGAPPVPAESPPEQGWIFTL